MSNQQIYNTLLLISKRQPHTLGEKMCINRKLEMAYQHLISSPLKKPRKHYNMTHIRQNIIFFKSRIWHDNNTFIITYIFIPEKKIESK